LYQRYLSLKIEQLLVVFVGIEEQLVTKKKTKINNLFFKYSIFIYKIVDKNYNNHST